MQSDCPPTAGTEVHPGESFSQRTIGSLLEVQAGRLGGARAISSPDGPSISYGDLFVCVQGLVASLHAQGIQRSTRLAIVMPNGFNIAVALLAASSAAVAVPLNPVYQSAELENYFREAGVSHVLVQAGGAPAARQVAEKMGLPLFSLAADGRTLDADVTQPAPALPAGPAADDVAMILLTSGSTGRPKKVPLTHRNVCAAAASVSQSLGLGEQDVCLSMWEQHHIGGLVDLLLAPLISGGQVICAGSFDAARFYELLERDAPTWFQGVPTTLRELLHVGRTRGRPPGPGSLRFLRSVAAALPPAQMAELESAFGVPVIQTFGMTEAAPLITTNRLPPGLRKPGSAGSPCGPRVEIMDDRGQPLPMGSHGEVAVRGENVFAGYEDDDQANAQAFRNGWFYTGDTGYFDADGFLFLRGRVKEMINRGGEKISPYEVEDVLARHPAVAEVAVFARPHPSLGEDVGAALVLRPDQGLSEAEARAWVSARLSAFKVPRNILFLERLPRCPVGKVRRQELAELARQAEGRASPTPPANPLEAFLARLWASELDVPVVGVEDDFVALGGDSLSSVRLLAATESLLGVRFSNDALAELTTVRGMARHIINQGYSPDVLPDLDVDAALLRAATQTARSTGDEAEDADGSGAENKDAKSHASGQASKSMGEALLNILTPQELLDALADPQVAGGLRPVGTGPGQDHETWLAQTREGIARAPNALRWQRQALDEYMHLYTAGGSVNPGEKTLLVGFTGRALRLMMPTYRFLMHLDADRFDMLLLRSADRGHYATGIPGRGGDMASLGAWLDSWATAQGYGRRISFGTSAGGLAALCVGLARQWDRAIAVGADLPSSHPEIEAALKQAAQGTTASRFPLVVLMYAALNARDQGAAREVGAILPFARHRRIKGTDVHNVLDVIYRRGMLRVRLHELLVGDPGGEVQASRPG